MTNPADPATDRTVPATAQHPGMTQIVRDGRTYQVASVGPEATEMLECHAAAIATGVAIPNYGSRWPDPPAADHESDARCAGSAAPVPSRVSRGRGRPSKGDRDER